MGRNEMGRNEMGLKHGWCTPNGTVKRT